MSRLLGLRLGSVHHPGVEERECHQVYVKLQTKAPGEGPGAGEEDGAGGQLMDSCPRGLSEACDCLRSRLSGYRSSRETSR